MHCCQLRLSLKQKDGFLEIATESNIRNFGRKAGTSQLTPDFLELTGEARPAPIFFNSSFTSSMY